MALGGSGISPAVFDALRRDAQRRRPSRGPDASVRSASATWRRSRTFALPLIGEGDCRVSRRRAARAPKRWRAPACAGRARGQGRPRADQRQRRHRGPRGAGVRDCADALDALERRRGAVVRGLSRQPESPLDPRAQAARPAPGQARDRRAARGRCSRGARYGNAGAARRVQDPLSFRCVAQVHGAALAALWNAPRRTSSSN